MRFGTQLLKGKLHRICHHHQSMARVSDRSVRGMGRLGAMDRRRRTYDSGKEGREDGWMDGWVGELFPSELFSVNRVTNGNR